MIHLYAVTVDAPPPSELSGIEDAPVTTVSCDELHAVVSEHDRAPATTERNALAHAHVVDAVARRQPAVPMRFGVDHADVTALRTAVDAAAPALRATIARVGDAVEFVVRSAVPAPGPDPVTVPAQDTPARGRSYLEARLARQRAASEARSRAATDLTAATAELAGLARAALTTGGRAGPERCFLVSRSVAEVFLAAAVTLVDDRDDLVVGGPWPPYTFARDAWATGGVG